MPVLDLPAPGDFGLVAIPGVVGKDIQIGQFLNGDGWSLYQHAFLYVGNGQIIEAHPGGASFARWDKYGDRARWSTGLIVPKHPQLIAEIGRSFEGVPYSFLDYAAIASHTLHMPWSPLLKDFIADQRHMICSQLVDAAWANAGDQLFDDDRWPGFVTPGALSGLLDRAQLALTA